MKGDCIYLDYKTNSCDLQHGKQCEGRETCEDYEERETYDPDSPDHERP
jgi:hypothetical protein